MPEQPNLPTFAKGQPVIASRLQALADRIGAIDIQYGDRFPVETRGWSPGRVPHPEHWIGVITNSPAGNGGQSGIDGNSGSDYADAHYYVIRQTIKQGLAATDLFDTKDDHFPNIVSGSLQTYCNIVTATNLAELPASGGGSGTHGLSVGTRVHVFALFARTASGFEKHYVFYHFPGILYGQLSSDWSGGNSISVNRVADSGGTALPGGLSITDTVMLWCVWTGTASGTAWEPWGCYLQSGNIIAYRVLDPTAGTYVAINPPWLTAGDPGGGTQYQGYFDDATGHAVRDDLAARP